MIDVNDATIEAWKTDGVHKEFRINIDGTNYGNDKITDDSFNLRQAILDDENFEAIGCIASSFSVELHAQFSSKVKDKRIKVFVKAGNTQEIQVFDGYVTKCTKTANGWKRQIEAYDYLYIMSGQSGNTNANNDNKKKFDITDWFNDHANATTYQLLQQVCSKFSIPLRDGNRALANGQLTSLCGSVKKVSGLSALDLIKAIMQINFCFGYITGDGYFSWKYLTEDHYFEGWLYPSGFLFPETTLYPGYDADHDRDQDEGSVENYIGEYEHLEYQDFKMLPIDKIIVRNHENDEHPGISKVPEGTPDNNSYIIQGNILICDGGAVDFKTQAATDLFDVANSTYYVPFESDGMGLPYLECGDCIHYYDFIGDQGHASLQRFHILSRTLSGGQHMKDHYEAKGNEYLHEFVSGQSMSDDDYVTQKEMEKAIDEAAGLYNIISVAAYTDIPDPPATHTLYVVQGEIATVRSLQDDQEPSMTYEEEGE